MTGPGGRTIARVSVRVLPDVKGFRAKVEEELDRLRDFTIDVDVDFDVDPEELRAKLAGIRDKVTVPVDFDVDKGDLTTAKLLAKGNKLKIPAQVEVSNADLFLKTFGHLKIQADVDKSLLDRQFESFKFKPIKISADLETTNLEAALKRVSDQMKSVVRTDFTLLERSFTRLGNAMDTVANKTQAAFNRIRGGAGTLRNTVVQVGSVIQESFSRAGERIQGAIRPRLLNIQNDFRRLGSIASPVTSRISAGFSALARGIGRGAGVVTGAFGRIGSAISGVGRFLAPVASGFTSLGKSAISIGGSVLGGAAALGQFALQAGRIIGIAALVGGAGDLIAIAWSTASTAIAAVPAALALIGAPIAAIKIGMDGIKKAAKALEPAFKDLQTTVSATFEKGLTPVFQNLAKNLFPTLKAGINGTAQALVNMATQLGNFLTDAQGGLPLVKTLFDNVNSALGSINLVPLADGLLRLAGNKAALDALAGAVNNLGKDLQKIANNPDLNTAFEGLGKVLNSVEDAFTALINNGISAFASAAPGIQEGLDGITNFFGKFNYKQLGEAIGGAFRGIGQAIESIPQSTVDNITASFQSLGETLQSQTFKQGIQGIADLVPLAVGALNLFAGALDLVGNAVLGAEVSFGLGKEALGDLTDALGITTGAGDRARASLNKLKDEVNGVKPPVLTAGQAFSEAGGGVDEFGREVDTLITSDGLDGFKPAIKEKLVDPLTTLPQTFKTEGDKLVPAIEAPLQKLPQTAQQAGEQFTNALQTTFGKAPTLTATALAPLETTAIEPVNNMGQRIVDFLNPIPQKFMDSSTRAVIGFGTGLKNLSPTAEKELFGLQETTNTGLAPLADTSVPQATQAMVDALNTSLPGFGTALQTGLTQMGPLVDAAFAAISTTNIPTALTTMGTALTTGFTTLLGPAITTGFQGLGIFFDTGFLTLATTNITTGLTAMGTSLTAGFTTLLGPAVTTGFTGLGTFFDLGFLTLANTNVLTGMTAVGTALTAQFSTILGPAVTTGFQGLGTFFTTGFNTIASTNVTPGMTTIANAVTTGFQQVQAAIDQGFTQAKAAFTQGFADMNQSATQGFADLNRAATDGMRTFVDSIKKGATDVVTAVRQMVTDAVNEAKKLEEGFRAAGENAVAAMASAIRSGQNQVVAAARETVAAANQAAQDEAKINSPSRVWYGFGTGMIEGLVDGLEDDRKDAAAAGAATAQAAISAAQEKFDSLGQLQISAAFSDATAQITAKLSNDPIFAKAPLLLATLQTVVDGKIIQSKAEQVVTEFAKDLNVGVRGA